MAAKELKKSHVTELKCLASPPAAVKDVMSAVVALLGHPKRDAEDWRAAQRVLADVNFLELLQNLDPKTVKPAHAQYAREKLSPYSVEDVKKKSLAASFVYTWAVVTVDQAPQGEGEDSAV